MSTVSYVVYDSESGEVVHVHVQPVELSTSPEEIIQIVGVSARRLAVLEVPTSQMPPHPVRIRNGKLHRADEDLAMAGGDVEGGFAEPIAARTYQNSRSEQ